MAAILLRAARASRSLALPRYIGASPSPLSSSSSAASTAEAQFPAAATPGIAADVDEAVIVGGEGDDLRSRVFRLRLAKRSATEALEKWAGEGRSAPAPELRRIARDLSRARRYKHALEMAEPRCLSEPQGNCLPSKVSTDLVVHSGAAGHLAETGSKKGKPRAKWSHQMRLYLIRLLADYDVPGFRTQNAWSNEAWTHIVSQLNQKFGVSFSMKQAKQKEQDLKKDYRSVKDLLDESGFGWDSERNMVEAPDSVWASFAARRNSKDALQWRDKSFPYYDELVPLYEGRYAEGRTRQGMDHYASKTKNTPVSSSQPTDPNNLYQSQPKEYHCD